MNTVEKSLTIQRWIEYPPLIYFSLIYILYLLILMIIDPNKMMILTVILLSAAILIMTLLGSISSYSIPKTFKLINQGKELEISGIFSAPSISVTDFTKVQVSRVNTSRGTTNSYCKIITGRPNITIYDGISLEFAKELGEKVSQFLECPLDIKIHPINRRSQLFRGLVVTIGILFVIMPFLSTDIIDPLIVITIMIIDCVIAMIILFLSLILA